MWKAFHSLQHLLCRQGVSLHRRLLLLQLAIIPVLMWGSGSWDLDLNTLRSLRYAHIQMVSKMARFKRKPDEKWVDFFTRSFAQCLRAIDILGFQSADVLYLRSYHGYCGHLARMPSDMWLSVLLAYRDLSWWRNQRELNLAKRARHCRKGGHRRYEARIDGHSSSDGFDWKSRARDYFAWREDLAAFVASNAVTPPRCDIECR